MGWLGVAETITLGLLVNESSDVSPWLARKLVRWAAWAWYTDPCDAAIHSEEWAAIIADRPGKLLKLGTALGFVGRAATTRWLRPHRPGAARSALRLSRRRLRGAILVGLATGTLGLSGVSAASGSAQPGSALYGMKRSAENAQITLAGSDAHKGSLYLDFAGIRLSEATQAKLTEPNLNAVLSDMDSEVTAGAKLLFTDAVDAINPNDLTTVNSFVNSQALSLAHFKDTLSGDSRTRVLHSITIVDRIHVRSIQIAVGLECKSQITVTNRDAYGPVPLCRP